MLFTDFATDSRFTAEPGTDPAPAQSFEPEQVLADQARRRPFDGSVNLRDVAATAWPPRPTAVACVPARNEAETLAACLAALRESLAALGHAQSAILVVANNSSDETFPIAASASAADGVPILACDAEFSDDVADVGHVRRFALECAAALAGPDAILFSTDADTEVALGWAHALAGTLERGAAMAYGPVLCDAAIATLDPRSASMARLEQALGAAHAELWAALVPGRAQALSHTPGSASMAVRSSAYLSVGGLPPLPVAEDRGLADCFIENGGAVAVSPSAAVHSSTRLSGRARGGMADTLAARRKGDALCDAAFLPTKRFAWLALAYRLLAGDGDSAHALLVAQKLGVPISLLLPSSDPLGRRWAAVRRAAAPVRPMTIDEARLELDVATRLVRDIRAETEVRMEDIETPILAVDHIHA